MIISQQSEETATTLTSPTQTQWKPRKDVVTVKMCDGSQQVYRGRDNYFHCPYPNCIYQSANSPTFQGHVKICRYAAAGVVVGSGMAYPTPAPEPSSSHPPGDDTTMDDAGEMLSDDPVSGDMEIDEESPDLDFSMDEALDESHGTDDDKGGDADYEDDFYDDDKGDDTDYEDVDDDDGSGSQDGAAPKAGWSEDTVQTEAMAQLGICVNTAARVVVCIACASAIKPSKLSEHFAKVHPLIPTTAGFAEDLTTTYDLYPAVDSRPGSIVTAIYGLELVSGYLTCDACGYASKTEAAMARHMKKVEGCETFRERFAQTFRPSSKRGYFGVDLEPEPSEEPGEFTLDPVAYLTDKFAPIAYRHLPIKTAKTPCDANHFLNIEKWDLYVEGKTGAEITDLLREREPRLRNAVRICVERFADQVIEKLTVVGYQAQAAMGDYTGIGLTTNKLKDFQDDRTRKAYSKVATDCVVYCLGVITGSITEFKTTFNEEMASAGNNLMDALQRTSTSDQDSALQHFLFSIFNQKRSGLPDKYSFLAYSFLVPYSFTDEGTLRGCNIFTQFFSKLIFFGRGAIFNRITSEAERDNKGFFEVYEDYKCLLLIRSDYPLSPIYSTKNLAKRISRDQQHEDKVAFVGQESETAVLGKITIKLRGFGEWYRGQLVELEELQEGVFGGIGFNDKNWIDLTVPDELVDEVNSIRPGFCFIDVERNDLKKHQEAGLRALFHHPRLKDRYGTMLPGGRFVINAVACQDLLHQSEFTRTKLAGLLHFGPGGVGRGTEFTANYIRNHPQGDIRNVKVIDGELCLVGGYNKTTSRTEKQKPIIRWIPKSLYRACLIDWCVMRPMEVVIAAALGMEPAVEELAYRLCPEVHQAFNSDTFSKCLKRDSHKHIGQTIGISDLRDLQSNIVSKHRDPEALVIKNSDDTCDLQQGHTTMVANASYNLTPDRLQGVREDTIKAYRRASHWWQHITGIQLLKSTPTSDQTKADGHTAGTAPASLSGLESQMALITNRFEALTVGLPSALDNSIGRMLAIQARKAANAGPSSEVQRDLYIPHPSLIGKLRKFLQNKTAVFKIPEQAEATEYVLAGGGHLLFVAPTGSGKTIAYMLPAVERGDGVTCVLLPLSSLHTDFERRCSKLKIESSRWTPTNRKPRSKIVFVSPEHAQRKEFTDYLFESRSLGHLQQIVVDEVHLVATHESFRFCFLSLRQLASLGVSILMLSATVPIPLRAKILSMIGIDIYNCHIIHCPTDRPEISYNVKLFPTLKGAKERLVKDVKAKLASTKSTSFRGLVFCRSTDDVDKLAEMIGCMPYHAGRPKDERLASFNDWVDGKHKFMVCSSLMGCGIDVDGVEITYHAGTPWSIQDFAQESGRAGRSGKLSHSYVYAGLDEREPDEGGEDLYGKATMRDWVLQSSVCRRTALSHVLDNGRTTCTLLVGSALCDVCLAESLKEHPGQLVPFVTPTVSASDVPKPRPLPRIPATSLEYETSRSAAVDEIRPVTPEPEPPILDQEPAPQNPPSNREDLTRKRGEDRSEASKRPRVSQVTGPVQNHKVVVHGRTNNAHLTEIEERAIGVVTERILAQPPPAASNTNNVITIWGNELSLEIAVQMVQDVRANVTANIRGCALCYMIAGVDGTTHKSGNRCLKMPLTGKNVAWNSFKEDLQFIPGILCFNCLLPTNENTNMAGAEYHENTECTNRYFVRTVLFGFYQYGQPDLKAFIKANLDDVVWEKGMADYLQWLVVPPGNDIPNHLKLYWWILKFYKRVP